jgi:hypothetical protein
MSFRASINHFIAISTSLETFEILNLVTALFLLCLLISNSVSSRLLNLYSRRVVDGQIDLSSPKYENHFLNAVLCVPSTSSPLKTTMHVENKKSRKSNLMDANYCCSCLKILAWCTVCANIWSWQHIYMLFCVNDRKFLIYFYIHTVTWTKIVVVKG